MPFRLSQAGALGEREREIASLRAEKRQLENARFVLDNRISELDAERAPVAEHVSRLEGQLRSMYDELVAKFNRDKDSTLETKATKDRLASLIAELKRERLAVRSRQGQVDALLRDLQELHRLEDSHLRHGVNRLVARYISRDTRITGVAESPGSVAKRVSESASADGAAAAAAARSGDGDSDAPVAPSLLTELLRQREELVHAHDTLSRRVAYLSRTKEALAHTAVRENSTLLESNNEYRREVALLRQREQAAAAAAALAERHGFIQGAPAAASRTATLQRGSHETSTSQNLTLATPLLRKGAGGQQAQHVRAGRLSTSASQPQILLPALGSSLSRGGGGPDGGDQYDDGAANGPGIGGDSTHSRRLAALSQLSSSVDRVVGLLPPSIFADRVVPPGRLAAASSRPATAAAVEGSDAASSHAGHVGPDSLTLIGYGVAAAGGSTPLHGASSAGAGYDAVPALLSPLTRGATDSPGAVGSARPGVPVPHLQLSSRSRSRSQASSRVTGTVSDTG